MHDEARKDVPGIAKHQREQPNDPAHIRLVGEGGDKASEVDLRLVAGRSLEANLERPRLIGRSDRGHEALYGSVGAAISPLPNLAGEPDCREVRKRRDAL